MIYAIISTILFSCQQEPAFIEDSKNSFKIVNTNPKPVDPSFVHEGAGVGTFQNVPLPKNYTSRSFIQVGGMSYDIVYLPGNVVKYNSKDSTYRLVTLQAVLKDTTTVKVTTLDNILYSNKINNSASFNASALIGNANVEAKEIMEVTIQDIATSAVPKNAIDIAGLKTRINSIPAAERKNYFFVQTATLTLANTRKFYEAKFDAKVNATFVTADGKVYTTANKFASDRVVSVDLIALENMF